MPKISMDKQYKTRDGKPVRILCTDRRNFEYTVIALIPNEDGTERAATYTEKGESIPNSATDTDLIEVPEEHEIHVLKFTDGSMTMQLSKALSKSDLERWKASPFYLGVTKIVLPVKE